ncbi:AP-4 complex subunit mu [Iris pallida]|uniref:AP-4 complex subunit mu n=1 Tax=Iris pallida TaxID=29817 RepID=A0AAX6HDC8_IRIPA|nr:AP-4 complex subunit mu [Iris pallida]
MKSYLTGNPKIHLALNEDLSIGRNGASGYDYRSSAGGGVVILDDCNFHESVHLDSFDVDRTLALVPPDGEFPVMNYRMTQEFKPPFRINALIEEAGMYKAEVILKIRADFPSCVTANTISVQMPLPSYTTRVSFELEAGAVGQTTDFKEGNRKLEGSLKKACFSYKAEASEASLKEKKHVDKLELEWNRSSERDGRMNEEVLQGLQPPPNLRALKLDGYNGVWLPKWTRNSGSLSDMHFLDLERLYELLIVNCHNLLQLPLFLGAPSPSWPESVNGAWLPQVGAITIAFPP